VNLEHELKLQDIGDIAQGLSHEDAKMLLSATIAEVIRRGGVPFVMGSSSLSQLYYSAAGLMVAHGNDIGVLNISPTLGTN